MQKQTSNSPCPAWRTTASGFTLVELLITIAIVATLVALLIPAARSAIGSSRSFKCQMAQRSVAFDFDLFADDTLHPSRGEDDLSDPDLRVVPRGQFRLETFVDSQYGADEFWDTTRYGTSNLIRLPDASGRDPMRCPEIKGDIELRRNVPCSQGAVGPPQNVSFGFNVRLHLSESRWANGDPRPLGLTPRILQGDDARAPSAIPLLIDVDGNLAAQKGVSPLFVGPSLQSTSLLANDAYWFPGQRHAGGLNAGFLDGHVEHATRPLDRPKWAWDFAPRP